MLILLSSNSQSAYQYACNLTSQGCCLLMYYLKAAVFLIGDGRERRDIHFPLRVRHYELLNTRSPPLIISRRIHIASLPSFTRYPISLGIKFERKLFDRRRTAVISYQRKISYCQNTYKIHPKHS